METTASEYFGNRAREYDSLIRRCVPRYDEMLARLGRYLPDGAERVVELGCGTGNLTLRLAERYPGATLLCVDAAGEMLALTRARLGPAAARAEFVERRFEDMGLAPGGADLVTSCISLHHVEDKAALYADLYAALEPGGRFVLADQMAGVTERIHGVNWEAWLAFCRLDGHCSEDEVRSLLDHAHEHDHYTPVPEHFRLLAEAGFTELDCVWRNWIWGIVCARRPD